MAGLWTGAVRTVAEGGGGRRRREAAGASARDSYLERVLGLISARLHGARRLELYIRME
jgi:hypothetical protein